jgi:HK97 family phage prohead protease
MKEFINKDGGSLIDFDNSKGIIKTYINAFNIKDLQNDISLPGSFAKTFKENFKNIFWYLNHDSEEMLGIPLELYEDSIGAIAVAQFNLKKQVAMDVYEDYKLYAQHGRSLQHSVAVRAIKYEIKPNPENPSDEYDKLRIVSEWKMREFSSLTMSGANPYTPVLELKNENEIINEIKFITEALTQRFSDEKMKLFEQQLIKLDALLLKADKFTLKEEPKKMCENCGAEYTLLDDETEDEYICKACSKPVHKPKSEYDYNYLVKNFKL